MTGEGEGGRGRAGGARRGAARARGLGSWGRSGASAAVVAVVALATTGCPGPPPTPPPGPTPAGQGAAGGGAPGGAGEPAGGGSPAPGGPPPAAGSAPDAPGGGDPGTGAGEQDPAAPGGPAAAPWGAVERLARGARLRVRAERALGLVEVLPASPDAPALARLDVAAGPLFFQALLPAGAVLAVGGEELEVASLDPPKAIGLRRRPGGPADAPWVATAWSAGTARLRGLAFHALEAGPPQDGVVVAVGNVRATPAGPRVAVHAFPAGYAQDPTRGFDLHPEVGPGDLLEGRVLRARVVAVEPGDGQDPSGSIELAREP